MENPWFRGIGPGQLRWASTTFLLGVYQPIAWMILKLEYVVAGLDPRPYHATSLVHHTAVAVALFALLVSLLRRCGGPAGPRPGRDLHIQRASAVAAMLFAVHPLRVEVVAWASCQPYLPCALFSILAVLAYLRSHDEPRPRDAAGGGRRRAWWLATLPLFAAALLSKTVAVTLPFVLLTIVSFRRVCKTWSPGVGLAGWPADVEGFSMAVTGARRMLGVGGRQRFSG